MLLMLHSINWPNFIFGLPLLLEILNNMFIVNICFPVCDVINFELNLALLSSRKQKLKIIIKMF